MMPDTQEGKAPTARHHSPTDRRPSPPSPCSILLWVSGLGAVATISRMPPLVLHDRDSDVIPPETSEIDDVRKSPHQTPPDIRGDNHPAFGSGGQRQDLMLEFVDELCPPARENALRSSAECPAIRPQRLDGNTPSSTQPGHELLMGNGQHLPRSGELAFAATFRTLASPSNRNESPANTSSPPRLGDEPAAGGTHER